MSLKFQVSTGINDFLLFYANSRYMHGSYLPMRCMLSGTATFTDHTHLGIAHFEVDTILGPPGFSPLSKMVVQFEAHGGQTITAEVLYCTFDGYTELLFGRTEVSRLSRVVMEVKRWRTFETLRTWT